MYSYEDRKRAVELYIKYDLSAADTIRELGYPNRHSLINWYKEFQNNGDLHRDFRKVPKYSKEERATAVAYYLEHGKSISRTCRHLGYPSRTLLRQWLEEDAPEQIKSRNVSGSMIEYPQDIKNQAVIDLCSRTEPAREVARKYGVSRVTLYQWKNRLLPEESCTMKKEHDEESLERTKEELSSEVDRLRAELAQLKKETYRLRMEKDILEKAAEIIKKDPGVNLSNLRNREKARLVDALRTNYKFTELLKAVHISRSTYYYEHQVLIAPDKYSALRGRIHDIFLDSKQRYGYRRIYGELKNRGETVSEKVIRRIMAEEKLIVPQKRARKYSSYKGEITPAVPNLLRRDFHADKPNVKWLTDITEFSIPAGKVYLSPIIDCFDGGLVSWTIGTSPNAELANTMLDKGIATLKPGEHPILHSDRGCHYRWPGWIAKMDAAHLIRSMSKKGCSPDNSACEGFFGRLKNEFFYSRDWKGVSIDVFIDQLNAYLVWYNEVRIKKALGWRSPIEYRRALGLIA